MRLQRCVPLVAIGIFCGYAAAQAQDILRPTITGELAAEWGTETKFVLCVKAIRLHGQGSDDLALQALSDHETAAVQTHYKIAKGLTDFWDIVAGAGTPPPGVAIDCSVDLSNTLDLQFAVAPGALADADDDSGKSTFLALSDLLMKIPPGGIPVPGGAPVSRNTVANVYRRCFSVDPNNMFNMVKCKLGRR